MVKFEIKDTYKFLFGLPTTGKGIQDYYYNLKALYEKKLKRLKKSELIDVINEKHNEMYNLEVIIARKEKDLDNITMFLESNIVIIRELQNELNELKTK